MKTKEIGKIESIEFGIGGYQDAMIGLNVTLSGKSWGVGANKSAWDYTMIKPKETTQWTEKDRTAQYAEIVRYISGLLSDAKVQSVSQLKGKPIEAEFEDGILKSWRILTEAL